MKLTGYPEPDLEAIKHIRRAIGGKIGLQVDTNSGGGDLKEVLELLKQLEEFDIAVVEDPLWYDGEVYRTIKNSLGRAKLMADLAANWPHVLEVISDKSVDMVNHHPNNQGGLITALKIEAVAEAAGLDSAIGSSGIFGIQNTAFQILSSVIGLNRPCEDIGIGPYYEGPTKGEYDFERDPSILKDPYPQRNGTIEIPDLPGLGVEIDRERLAQVTERKEVIKS